MKIDHVAIWTKDLERLKSFYVKYFDGVPNNKYINNENMFESYFISFGGNSRIEIMTRPGIPDFLNDPMDEFSGYIHIAISVGSKEKVNSLTEILRADDYLIVREPRTTGDGYYECVVADPDGNKIEIVE